MCQSVVVTLHIKKWGLRQFTCSALLKRLLKLQAQLAAVKMLIVVDKLGYVPLSQTGDELLFEVFSQRHERGSTIVTSNLPFDEWASVFGNQRLTGALLDRLTHHVHVLEMNGESYRFNQSRARRRTALRVIAMPRIAFYWTESIGIPEVVLRRSMAGLHQSPVNTSPRSSRNVTHDSGPA